jgi:hypothetical protein
VFHASRRTLGPIYLPTVSYVEMNQWTLPPCAAAIYGAMLAEARSSGRYEIEKPFVRGGIWKNFLSRYPEANWMHKRMLDLSARVGALAPGIATTGQLGVLHDLLYAAQANDAYWHGLFGGLYLPHLRRANFRNLVALEAALDLLVHRPASARHDVDLDGIDELFLQNGTIQAVVRLDGNAAVVEFDDYRLRQNFGDTLRRHAEHYHALIGGQARDAMRGTGIASAHDRVRFKQEISPEDAAADDQPQSMLRDAFQPRAGQWTRLDRYVERPAEGLAAEFDCDIGDGSARKRIVIDGEVMSAGWRLERVAPGNFRTTLAIAMPSCDGVAGRYVVDGAIPGGFGQSFEWPLMSALVLEDLFMGGAVALAFSPPARVVAAPYRTVSQSEDGFELIMQAVNIEISWPVSGGDEMLALSMRTRVL